MSLTSNDVHRIAKLARIAVTEAEVEEVGLRLNGLFDLIETLRAVDTQGIEPMAHPQDLGLRLRPDAVRDTDRRDDFQAIAPQTEAGLYLVPKVIE